MMNWSSSRENRQSAGANVKSVSSLSVSPATDSETRPVTLSRPAMGQATTTLSSEAFRILGAGVLFDRPHALEHRHGLVQGEAIVAGLRGSLAAAERRDQEPAEQQVPASRPFV